MAELVAHLQEKRSELRQQWVDRISEAHLRSAMTSREVFNEVTSVYDNYVAVLETGSVGELQRYARDLSERIIPRGVETHEVVGIVLLLRDVLARSLFDKYRDDFDLLHQVLDTYEQAEHRGRPSGRHRAGRTSAGPHADPHRRRDELTRLTGPHRHCDRGAPRRRPATPS